jgi:uncharacterized membrane protein YbaN (DUF454 family)
MGILGIVLTSLFLVVLFVLFEKSPNIFLKYLIYQEHTRLQKECQHLQIASSEPKGQEMGFNNGIMCTEKCANLST